MVKLSFHKQFFFYILFSNFYKNNLLIILPKFFIFIYVLKKDIRGNLLLKKMKIKKLKIKKKIN